MALIKVKERGRESVNLGRRNLITNGAMQVGQRGTQTGIRNSYGVDRFLSAGSGAQLFTYSQSTTVPSGQGFSYSTKLDVTTADTSVAAGDYHLLIQRFEGQDLQHLKYGTSSAESLTIQFWVRSAKTGTHIVELTHVDAGYQNSQAYTITSADTWQKVILTFDGYQTTAITNDNTVGFTINWWLMAGSTYSSGTLAPNTWDNTDANRAVGQVNVVDSTSNEFYITGVQLELGSTATDFEHLSYPEELSLCSRYYHTSFSGETTIGGSHPANYSGKVFSWCDHYGSSPDRVAFNYQWPVQMRDIPTVTMYGNGWTSARMSKYNAGSAEYTIDYASGVSRNGLGGYYDVAGVNGDFVVAYVEASAEL